jgi:hypothetical protein
LHLETNNIVEGREWREVKLGLGERVEEKDCWRLVEDHE